MKPIIQKLWMLIAMLCSSLSASAYDFEVDGVYYDIVSVSDLTCEVVNGNYDGVITIPAIVTYKGKDLSVISISQNAFANSSISEINLSEGLQTIKSYSFSNCYKLTKISIPSTVSRIENNAFSGCTSLTAVCIEDGTTEIWLGDNGFHNTRFEDIPSYIKEYEMYYPSGTYYNFYLWSESLFAASPLKKLYIGRDCNYRTKDYDKGFEDRRGKIHGYPTMSPFCHHDYDKITIGGSVSKLYGITFKSSDCDTIVLKHGSEPLNIIDSYRPDYDYKLSRDDNFDSFLNSLKSATVDRDCNADIFYNKKELHEVIIGENLKRPTTEFGYCQNLEVVRLGSSVESIAENMFLSCENLRGIDLPQSLVSIEKNAFKNTAIESIEFPNQLKSIGSNAFSNTLISDLTFPSSIQELGSGCFEECENLKTVALPENVNTLPTKCFYNCQSLENVHFQLGLKELSNSAFYGCQALSMLEFPLNLEVIGEDTFGNCVNLKSIVLGPNLLSIGKRAFAESDLDSLISWSAKPPVIENQNTFNNFTYLNCKVEIPEGSYTTYSSSDVWKDFWDIKENSELNSGITDIYDPYRHDVIDYNNPYEVFNFNGIYVNNNCNDLPSGLYILRQGVNRVKILIHK